MEDRDGTTNRTPNGISACVFDVNNPSKPMRLSNNNFACNNIEDGRFSIDAIHSSSYPVDIKIFYTTEGHGGFVTSDSRCSIGSCPLVKFDSTLRTTINSSTDNRYFSTFKSETISPTNLQEKASFWIASDIEKGWEYVDSQLNDYSPSLVKVTYPFELGDKATYLSTMPHYLQNEITLNVITIDEEDEDDYGIGDASYQRLVLHEYSHHVMYDIYGASDYNRIQPCQLVNNNGQDVGHFFPLTNTIGCAWSEGFAHMLPHAIMNQEEFHENGQRGNREYNIEKPSTWVWKKNIWGQFEWEELDGSVSNEWNFHQGATVEGRVGAALHDIWDGEADSEDARHGFGRILSTLTDPDDNSPPITILDFYKDWRETHSTKRINDAFQTNTIVILFIPQKTSTPTSSGIASNSVTVDWTAPSSIESIQEYEIFRYASPKISIANVTASQLSYTDGTVLPSTTYQYTVSAKNQFGNGIESDPLIVTTLQSQSQTAPVLDSISNISINEGSSKTITARATDTNGDTIRYSLSSSPSWVSINSNNGVISINAPSELTKSSYSVTVIATDNDGTDSESFRIYINEVNQAPILDTIPDYTGTVGDEISFTISATDYDIPSQTLRYSISGSLTGSTINSVTGLFSWTPIDSQAGTHFITFTVTDNGTPISSDIQSISLIITEIPDTIPPSITAPANVTYEATNINTILSDSQIGTPITSDNKDPNPTITHDIPNSFPLGDTTITYTATDSSNNESTATQIITIADTTPPIITAPADITQKEGITVNLGEPISSDIFHVTITHDIPDSFQVGTTIVRYTATDSNGNTSYSDQRIVITESKDIIPPTNLPEIINDSFDDSLDGWSKYSVLEPDESLSPRSHENYNLSLDSTIGNPSPSAHISGDGFVSSVGIRKTVDISSISSDSPLYLSFDYRAKSDSSDRLVTNANIGIYNGETGVYLFSDVLINGGTTDSGWQSWNRDISDITSEYDTIIIRISMYDSWTEDYNQQNWYDNIILGTEQQPVQPAGQSAPPMPDENYTIPQNATGT